MSIFYELIVFVLLVVNGEFVMSFYVCELMFFDLCDLWFIDVL